MDPEKLVGLIVIEPEDCEAYQIPEGVLLIGRSDPLTSMGFVDILPGKALPPVSRTLPGFFKQFAGKSLFKVHGSPFMEKELAEGQTIEVPANTEYSIENRGGKSLVFWKFEGDVSDVFEKLRKELPKVQFTKRDKAGYKELFEVYQRRREEAHIEGHY